MSRARRTVSAVTVAAATFAAATTAGAATEANRVLVFTTVNSGTIPWKLPGATRSAWAQLVNRVVDAPGQGDEVDFRKYFGVYAYVMRPTSGYTFTIRRILLQRFGGYRQICVIAAIGKPTGAVTQEKHMSAHYVKIKRGRLGFNIPDHIVVREQRAAVLYADPGSRTGACRA
jgi:hypothetical protein